MTKSNLKKAQTENFNFDVSAIPYASGAQTIGTSYEAIAIGDVATAGVAVFKNLDATNYVEIGVEVSAAFYAFAKLKPGEAYPIRLASGTIFAKANTAPVSLEYTIYSN